MYDSLRYPDGSYRAAVVATDQMERKGYGFSPGPVQIDNAVFPSVEVTSPHEGIVVEGTLWVSARASDPDGVVRRVDFYAERRKPLLLTRYRGGIGRSEPVFETHSARTVPGLSLLHTQARQQRPASPAEMGKQLAVVPDRVIAGRSRTTRALTPW